jgi:hypothetical protein
MRVFIVAAIVMTGRVVRADLLSRFDLQMSRLMEMTKVSPQSPDYHGGRSSTPASTNSETLTLL